MVNEIYKLQKIVFIKIYQLSKVKWESFFIYCDNFLTKKSDLVKKEETQQLHTETVRKFQTIWFSSF